VGSNTLINLDVRIIIATHKNLMELVGKGLFREDLYYRLLGISIQLPPLHERGNDILVLANHFIKEYCKRQDIPQKKLSKAAIDKMMSHRFPGNIRELKALVELGVVLADQDEIGEDSIQITFPDFSSELLSREMSMEEYNLLIVRHYLKKYNNKVRFVASKLGIGKSTIYRMLSENGIDAGPQETEEEENDY
jgi:DNA-binding NtrC family response regulator